MPWTLEEIETLWLGGERAQLPAEDVVRAFMSAEGIRGQEWVLSTLKTQGGGQQWGFAPFIQVYAFGTRIQTVTGVPGADALLGRLLQDDPAAHSELAAIHLLRSRCPDVELEIEPQVAIGKRQRRPDFRIRQQLGHWTYVEVCQLNRSKASTRMHDVLSAVVRQVASIPQPFLLELVCWKEPSENDMNQLIREAYDACQLAAGSRRDIGDLASLMVKAGDPAVLVPSILPENDGTRMSLAQTISGPGQANRQVLVRAPFADQRAEEILTVKARQLPRNQSGLLMVDVAAQPSAFESWTELVPHRFTPVQHTRVAGVLLFMSAITISGQGLAWRPCVRMIPNQHARTPLADWITNTVAGMRTESVQATGRPD